MKHTQDYQSLAENIIRYVGGKENIDGLIHCVTRLRFYLTDESKANDEAIQKLTGVLGVTTGGGQYQVIIGPAVNDVYDAVMSKLSLSESKQDTASTVPNNSEDKTILEKVK
ncbi:PTS transporter subunit EIIB, partial [Carnobacterium sp.]|uniref:PTS transporter subunit EIIB n=1 Tax=Carnobacterium sp. TaxID=48221 RepID=UPI0028ABB0B0